MEFIFATHNQGKMKEIRMLFAEAGLQPVRSLAETGLHYTPVEDGTTFTENAIKKALDCAEALRASGLCDLTQTAVLADDSGLAIDALDGRPGVYSARFLGEDTPYTEKNRHILEMLSAVPDERRTAQFVCVIACVLPQGRILTAEGIIEGVIARETRGENGFGYDPLFYLPAYGLTTAQLNPTEKNAISHRGQAIRILRDQLLSLGDPQT